MNSKTNPKCLCSKMSEKKVQVRIKQENKDEVLLCLFEDPLDFGGIKIKKEPSPGIVEISISDIESQCDPDSDNESEKVDKEELNNENLHNLKNSSKKEIKACVENSDDFTNISSTCDYRKAKNVLKVEEIEIKDEDQPEDEARHEKFQENDVLNEDLSVGVSNNPEKHVCVLPQNRPRKELVIFLERNDLQARQLTVEHSNVKSSTLSHYVVSSDEDINDLEKGSKVNIKSSGKVEDREKKEGSINKRNNADHESKETTTLALKNDDKYLGYCFSTENNIKQCENTPLLKHVSNSYVKLNPFNVRSSNIIEQVVSSNKESGESNIIQNESEIEMCNFINYENKQVTEQDDSVLENEDEYSRLCLNQRNEEKPFSETSHLKNLIRSQNLGNALNVVSSTLPKYVFSSDEKSEKPDALSKGHEMQSKNEPKKNFEENTNENRNINDKSNEKLCNTNNDRTTILDKLLSGECKLRFDEDSSETIVVHSKIQAENKKQYVINQLNKEKPNNLEKRKTVKSRKSNKNNSALPSGGLKFNRGFSDAASVVFGRYTSSSATNRSTTKQTGMPRSSEKTVIQAKKIEQNGIEVVSLLLSDNEYENKEMQGDTEVNISIQENVKGNVIETIQPDVKQYINRILSVQIPHMNINTLLGKYSENGQDFKISDESLTVSTSNKETHKVCESPKATYLLINEPHLQLSGQSQSSKMIETYECKFCDKSFCSKYNLKKNYEEIHSIFRKISCDEQEGVQDARKKDVFEIDTGVKEKDADTQRNIGNNKEFCQKDHESALNLNYQENPQVYRHDCQDSEYLVKVVANVQLIPDNVQKISEKLSLKFREDLHQTESQDSGTIVNAGNGRSLEHDDKRMHFNKKEDSSKNDNYSVASLLPIKNLENEQGLNRGLNEDIKSTDELFQESESEYNPSEEISSDDTSSFEDEYDERKHKYWCKYCKYNYSSNYSLKRHLKNCHEIMKTEFLPEERTESLTIVGKPIDKISNTLTNLEIDSLLVSENKKDVEDKTKNNETVENKHANVDSASSVKRSLKTQNSDKKTNDMCSLISETIKAKTDTEEKEIVSHCDLNEELENQKYPEYEGIPLKQVNNVSNVSTLFKRYPCTFCEKDFSQQHNMYRHIRNVHKANTSKSVKRFPCTLCKKYFSTVGLQIHARKVHNKEATFEEHLQSKPESLTRSHSEGQNSTNKLKTDQLDKKNKNGGDDNKRYQCKFCKKDFSQRCNLYRHIRKICLKSLAPSHSKVQSSTNKLKTTSHLYSNVTNSVTNVHKLCRIVQRFPCTFCKKHFVSEDGLQTHVSEVHNHNKGETKKRKRRSRIESKLLKTGTERHQCPLCKVESENLFKHVPNLHCKKTVDGKYLCLVCNKTFVNATNVTIHMYRHSDPSAQSYICYQCNKKCTSRWYLIAHIKTKHRRTKEYVCDHCKFTTGTKVNYDLHLSRHVESADEIKCKQCEFTCTRLKDLLKHRRQHFNWRQCDQCTYKTKLNGVLRLHLVTHMNEEEKKKFFKFRCSFCDFAAYRRYTLDVHLLQHQKPGQIEYFYCYHCSFKSKRKDLLKTHIFKHDEYLPVRSCFVCDFTTKSTTELNKHLDDHSKEQKEGFLRLQQEIQNPKKRKLETGKITEEKNTIKIKKKKRNG